MKERTGRKMKKKDYLAEAIEIANEVLTPERVKAEKEFDPDIREDDIVIYAIIGRSFRKEGAEPKVNEKLFRESIKDRGAWVGDWNHDGWEKQAHLRMWAYETRNEKED